ncbi:MAG: 5-formyltetrahydrofolate cyclo-ligase [Candidatus Curtissbacteria bacterium]|nr:5-formyltetrahydrofolate cyclo-ligase [Candidatus Curtissbacteria bacterium]
MNASVKQQKDDVRKKVLLLRDKLTDIEVEQKSDVIFHKVTRLENLDSAKVVLCYLSLGSEVKTTKIVQFLLKIGKKVVVPAYFDDGYILAELSDLNNLIAGPYGVLQPKVMHEVNNSSVDLAIIPGVAFSKDGIRLGYGKGVFDKLLAGSKAVKIGLAFNFQAVDELPREKHDLVVDILVNEGSTSLPFKNN